MVAALDPESLSAWPSTLALIAVGAEGEAQHEWALHTALRVTRDLAAAGARVLLVEAEAHGRLARILDAPFGPGIAEVLDGKMKVPAAARRPAGEDFYFIGPGQGGAVARWDAEAWRTIAERIRAGGARLLVFCCSEEWPEPEGIPGIEGAVLLDARGAGQRPAGARVLAQLVAPAEVRGVATDDRRASARPKSRRPRTELEAPAVLRRRERSRISTASVVLVLAGLAAVAYLLAGSGSDEGVGGAEVGAGASAALPPTIDPAAARRLRYSVQVESYSAFPDALRRERQLAGTVGVPVFTVPAVVDSVLYYRVFAGLTADADSARALLRALVQRGIKDSERAWDVRSQRLAFDLGTFPDRLGADARRRQLLEIGVPSYVVEVPTTAGLRHRLYAGGYESAAEAAVLGQLLERNGIQASLVERIGS